MFLSDLEERSAVWGTEMCVCVFHCCSFLFFLFLTILQLICVLKKRAPFGNTNHLRCHMGLSARAEVTKYHRLKGSNTRNTFLQNSEGWWSEAKASAQSCSWWPLSLTCRCPPLFCISKVDSSLSMSLPQIPPFRETTILLYSEPSW